MCNNLQDVITIENKGFNPVLNLYMNNGDIKFSETFEALFSVLNDRTINIADINGDNLPDVLITGEISSNVFVTNLYIYAYLFLP